MNLAKSGEAILRAQLHDTGATGVIPFRCAFNDLHRPRRAAHRVQQGEHIGLGVIGINLPPGPAPMARGRDTDAKTACRRNLSIRLVGVIFRTNFKQRDIGKPARLVTPDRRNQIRQK